MNNIVTIDGPSGAGKTTVARLIAEQLGLTYLPSGKLYRAAAYLLQEQHVDVNNIKQLSGFLASLQLELAMQPDGRVLHAGRDISGKLNTPEIGSRATIVSQHKPIREALLGLQRGTGLAAGCVTEGRSTAVEVFPEAGLKVWLTAGEMIRQLRKKQAEGEGSAQAIMTRDELDRRRQLAPMQKAEDAIVIDSSQLTAQEVADKIVREYRRRQEHAI